MQATHQDNELIPSFLKAISVYGSGNTDDDEEMYMDKDQLLFGTDSTNSNGGAAIKELLAHKIAESGHIAGINSNDQLLVESFCAAHADTSVKDLSFGKKS